MRKLLLLFFALLTGVSGAWADDVTVTFHELNTNVYNGTYCNKSNNVLNTVAGAGLAGVTFAASVIDRMNNQSWSGWDAGSYLVLKTTAAQTAEAATFTAPDGYKIKSYYIKARAYSSSYPYKIDTNATYNNETGTAIGSSSYVEVTKTLDTAAETASFWLYCNAGTVGNWLCVESLTVTLTPDALEDGSNYIIFSPSTIGNGRLMRNGSVSTENWVNQWKHTATSILLSNAGTSDYYIWKTGEEIAGGKTYTISSPNYNNLMITGYTIVGKATSAGDVNLTPAGGSDVTFSTSGLSTVSVSGLLAESASFTLSGSATNRIVPTFIKIYYDNTTSNSDYLALSSLSNSTRYQLTCGRGTMGVTNNTLANTSKDGVSASDFAIIQYNGDYHLYSVTDDKFISNTGAESDVPSYATKVMIEANPYIYNNRVYHYMLRYQNNYINTGGGQTTGAIINWWGSSAGGSSDEGNEFNILPDGDFTLTDAISGVLATAYTPFTVSTDDGDKTWYYLNARGKYLTYDAESSAFGLLDTKQYVESAQWAFIGDAINGFKILNRATNTYLAYSSSVSMSETPTLWKTGLHPATDGFRLTTNGTNNLYCGSSANLTMIDYALTYDNDGPNVSGGISGGAFNFEAVPNYKDEAQQYLAYVDQNVGSYFSLTSDANTTLKAYVDKEEITADELQTIYDTWTAGVKYPATGLYRLRSNYTGYVGNTAKNYMNTTAPGLASVTNTTGEGADVVIRLTNNGDGSYYIQAQGDYLQTPEQSAQVVRSTTPVAFTPIISTPGVVAWQSGSGQYGALHRAEANTLVGWESNSDASQWTVEAAPISLELTLNDGGDGSYYATLCLPFEVTLPSGTSAYTLTLGGTPSNAWLTKSEALSTVPAGTPVMLVGDDSPVTATIGSGYSATPLTTTSLAGVYVDKAVVANTDYFLGADDGVVGFYKWDGTTLAANRAYLPKGDLDVKGFAIDFGDADGISETMRNGNNEKMSAVYDLSGRCVNKPSKGLYIVNGRKQVVK